MVYATLAYYPYYVRASSWFHAQPTCVQIFKSIQAFGSYHGQTMMQTKMWFLIPLQEVEDIARSSKKQTILYYRKTILYSLNFLSVNSVLSWMPRFLKEVNATTVLVLVVRASFLQVKDARSSADGLPLVTSELS